MTVHYGDLVIDVHKEGLESPEISILDETSKACIRMDWRDWKIVHSILFGILITLNEYEGVEEEEDDG